MSYTLVPPRAPSWGLAGFILGAIALIIVAVHVSAMFAEPEQSAGTKIGEIAAEIRQSALRSLSGQPKPEPEPEVVAPSIFSYLMLAAPVLAGLAAILGAIGLFRREALPLPLMAIGLGLAAVVMQYAIWLALLAAGVCLMVAILNNLGSILGE
ncbi:hypothetical protein AB2B41_05825 [Marimonas sp. MJW-29]|uniref:Tripartite tricarboxylate transporter TctB family protein n=1 Tax=Sulfitobacter sediminis TaxID=3234186 RepID=A0ABV3RJH1_9RHOB